MHEIEQTLPLLESPPTIELGSPMPIDWSDRIPKHRKLWETAERQHYDPNTAIDWAALNPADFTAEQRVAISYWFATNSVFENSGVPACRPSDWAW